ncbi:MAG: hypothetical protein IID36_05655, partial [Planctomycetes bacterium]|nr:hypothetical protein [Planctomycetota bacterium]
CVNNTYPATANVTVDGGDSSLLVVTLDPALPDEDCCRVDLAGPSTSNLYITILKCDVNLDGAVSSADSASIKQRLGQPIGSGNFQYDVNLNGYITASDSGSVNQRIGNVAPACP